jgi:hypothetical protein
MVIVKAFSYSVCPLLIYTEFFSVYPKDVILYMTNEGGSKESEITKKDEVQETTELDHFNALIRARDRLIKLYEEFNKKYRTSGSSEHKALMDKYSAKLDAKETEIDWYKEHKDYLENDDLNNSEGE